MGLTAVTLLGENTVPILDALCRHLSDVTGLGLAADSRPAPASDRALDCADRADLVWGCGYLVTGLIASDVLDVEVVAAPVFAGQTGPVYHSVIVAADPSIGTLDDAAGRRLAVNETASWSGHHALAAHLADRGRDLSMFGEVVLTGSHRASVDRVRSGDADVAAIDHTVWQAVAPTGRSGVVRVIGRTRDWPAPPFALSGGLDPDRRRAVVTALLGLGPGDVPGLAGVAPATNDDYAVMHPP